MLTPGELCKLTSRLLGLEPNTTAIAWRALRENDEVTTGGRGRSAARCNSTDAANLLIATITKQPSKSYYKSWERYSGLKGGADRRFENDLTITPEFAMLPTVHTARAGVTSLIASAVSGSLEQTLGGSIDERAIRSVDVTFIAPLAQIHVNIIRESQPSLRLWYSDIPNKPGGPTEWGKRPRPVDESGDLRKIMRISGTTIFSLGRALRTLGADDD